MGRLQHELFPGGHDCSARARDSRVGNCNITDPDQRHPSVGGRPLCQQPRQLARLRPSAAAGATSTSPIGDNYLNQSLNTSATPARTISEITGSASLSNSDNKNFVSKGYKDSPARRSTATRRGRTTGARRSSSGRRIRPTTGGRNSSSCPTALPRSTTTRLSGITAAIG